MDFRSIEEASAWAKVHQPLKAVLAAKPNEHELADVWGDRIAGAMMACWVCATSGDSAGLKRGTIMLSFAIAAQQGR